MLRIKKKKTWMFYNDNFLAFVVLFLTTRNPLRRLNCTDKIILLFKEIAYKVL